MEITGIKSGESRYPLRSKPTETLKTGEAQEAQTSHADTVSVSGQDKAAFFAALRQKFDCVRSGSVAISGAYLEKCAEDPDKAKELEENLAAYEDCVRQGCQNARRTAQAAGGKLLSYSETWSIDSDGHITMTSCGTTEYDTGKKSWKNVQEETSEKRSGKVAVNVGKRARQIAAAKSREQIQQVLALLREDLADCRAGLSKGWCDESEIAKVEALMNQAKARMSQLPQKSDDSQAGIDAFDLASLM